MEIRDLPLDELVLDPNLNLRDRLDDFTVERYAEAWQRMPPVTVYEVDGRCWWPTGSTDMPRRCCWGGHDSPRRSARGA